MSDQAFIGLLKDMIMHHEKLLAMYQQLKADKCRMASVDNMMFLNERIAEETRALDGIRLTLNDYLSSSSME